MTHLVCTDKPAQKHSDENPRQHTHHIFLSQTSQKEAIVEQGKGPMIYLETCRL